MNKFWKSLIVIGLGATLISSAFSQTAGPQGGGIAGGKQEGQAGGKGIRGLQKLEAQIWEKLSPPLTSDQKTKLEAINKETKSALKGLRDKAQTGDKEALKTEFKKVQQARREKIMAMLTPEQKTSYQALLKDAMDKIKKGAKDGKGGKGGKGGGIG
ncbi:MAG: hypothetical protein IT203_11110 [Fimbriimonadaceae bacterium]|nr:hypothetical protein [Fimbriimonadaceae bacterium]